MAKTKMNGAGKRRTTDCIGMLPDVVIESKPVADGTAERLDAFLVGLPAMHRLDSSTTEADGRLIEQYEHALANQPLWEEWLAEREQRYAREWKKGT